MLLKKDYDTDAEEDGEGSTSTGEDESDGDEALDPNSKAYKKLPAAVKKQLENLSGQVESLYDENKKLKEVSAFELSCTFCCSPDCVPWDKCHNHDRSCCTIQML